MDDSLIPLSASQSVGRARTLDSYAQDTINFVSTGLSGADRTKRNYAGDWKRFTEWCTGLDQQALPASTATLAAYLTHLAVDEKKKLATIQRAKAAIRKAHQLSGLPSPTSDELVKSQLEGISRTIGSKQKQAPAFTMAYFKRVMGDIDTSHAKGLRDKALLFVGLAGAFRREELSNLDIEHVHQVDEGLIIEVVRSKTNQKGEAEEKAIFYAPDRRTCPVRAVMDWVQFLVENGQHTGPLFVSFRKGQRLTKRRLSTNPINDIVFEYLGSHAKDGRYTAHSLRASFVTIAKLAGADDSEVMNQTKHKTADMIRRYTRVDTVLQYNAGKKLGF